MSQEDHLVVALKIPRNREWLRLRGLQRRRFRDFGRRACMRNFRNCARNTERENQARKRGREFLSWICGIKTQAGLAIADQLF